MEVDKIYQLAMEFKPFEVENEVKRLLSEGVDPELILIQLRKAMIDACERFGKEFALPQLSAIIAAFNMGYNILKDKVKVNVKGKILMGTLGSMHYIGKDIIKVLYMADGFEVIDLGENLMAENFIKGIIEHMPHLVGISMFLTNAIFELGKIVDFLEKEGLRDRVKVIVGGVQGNRYIAEKYRLDGWGHDPKTALELANRLVSEARAKYG
ncbi:MAG: cobalamin-dependent protein [Nitrososphaeria archaeon]|nr:cobalamin-dependent protein [Nitrososphaeria archaeon]